MHIGLFVKDFAIGKKFSKDGLPTKSGAEFHAENHAKQLIKRGHKVSIFAMNCQVKFNVFEKKTSYGVLYPRHLRGRRFSLSNISCT